MRNAFAESLLRLQEADRRQVLLTGDLGFMAFETLQKAMGPRFINAGVAEQNMMAVAAGLARTGLRPWVYSIAPFAVLRPYEQIRNDVCLHRLAVKIVGNGGGYGYGIMGPTHHTLEDVALMRVQPHMRVFMPITKQDVMEAVRQMAGDDNPNYLRLGAAVKARETFPRFGDWRQLTSGDEGVVIGAGPVLGPLLDLLTDPATPRLEVWAAGIVPFESLPDDLLKSIRRTGKVAVIEEHHQACGINELVARLLMESGAGNARFVSLAASASSPGRFGSQAWHWGQDGLAGPGLKASVEEFAHA